MRLLLDRGTAPALTDFWNQRGRLYPAFLVPFFIIGLLDTLRRSRRQIEARMLLLLFFGFGVPLILTSRVHVGRLIFALPFLLLLVANGVFAALAWLAGWFERRRGAAPTQSLRRMFASGVICALLVGTACASWHDYRESPTLPNELVVVRKLSDDQRQIGQRGAAVLILDSPARSSPLDLEEEERRVADYRLHLDHLFRFVKSSEADQLLAQPGDSRPIIYFGGILAQLESDRALPSPCQALYYSVPDLLDEVQLLVQRRYFDCRVIIRQLPGP